MRPLKSLVLVKPDEPDTYVGLLIIPDSCKRRKNKGVIVAIGGGTKNEPMLLKTGMSVFNIKDCGVPVMYNNEEHFFIEQRDILAQDIS